MKSLKLSSRTILVGTAIALLRCSSTTTTAPPAPPGPAPLQPGEVCDPTNTADLVLRFDPPSVVIAAGRSRPVRAIVDPDICQATQATLAVGDGGIADAPTTATFDLRSATFDFNVVGSKPGATTVTIKMKKTPDSPEATATLNVEVRSGDVPACGAGESAALGFDAGHTTLQGTGGLAAAAFSVPVAAFTRADELALAPFNAKLSCATDLTGDHKALTPLGPAVKFEAVSGLDANRSLRRELDFVVPVNPAAMPDPARMRHVQVMFQSPMAKTPRAITIANPQFVKVGDAWSMHFQSPWIGTYQAVIAPDAGTRHVKRHLTHRGVLGISMGGGGAASFGMRHHNKFDMVGPLGGPSDWTWLLWYIETFNIGGFCPASDPTCTLPAPNLYPIDGPLVHTQDFNHWFYQSGAGNGGGFDRNEYSQLFWDLSAMQGNPNGTNPDPALAFFPAGPKATDTWVTGDTTGLPAGTNCAVPVDPIKDDPNQAQQRTIQSQCYKSRCDPKNAWVQPTGYFDDEYNPDGSKQVISFCDGQRAADAKSPYLNTWAQPDPNTAIPLNPALAVDLNKNGVRDFDEPVIRSGHEPWDDTGADGLFDAQEPGYDPVTNPDPNQDDYDNVINPNGDEKNHRFETGEPFKDVGLDGVMGTPQIAAGGFDQGEGDAKFTLTNGLQNFYAQDPHQIIHRWATNVPGGAFDDDALSRLSVWTDGGVRDLFNFGTVANHLVGALTSRRRADGRPIKSAAYYNNFENLPGGGGNINAYQPENVLWADVPQVAMMRYGNVDASDQVISQGDGQHVGTATQILFRLETSFYFAAAGWPDADRTRTLDSIESPETTTVNELGPMCEMQGRCEKFFTGAKTKRTGPIAVTLPPGYALEENRKRDLRYPVLYVLHGYGQDPRDLEAVAILFNNRVNSGEKSYVRRLPKFIIVYVDGRCRIGQDGKPECVRGTFYMNSARPGGVQLDSWFDEVVDYIDQNYRTLGPSDVDVIE